MTTAHSIVGAVAGAEVGAIIGAPLGRVGAVVGAAAGAVIVGGFMAEGAQRVSNITWGIEPQNG